eukprot:2410076-Prorocentrum_lima.AAC.1
MLHGKFTSPRTSVLRAASRVVAPTTFVPLAGPGVQRPGCECRAAATCNQSVGVAAGGGTVAEVQDSFLREP